MTESEVEKLRKELHEANRLAQLYLSVNNTQQEEYLRNIDQVKRLQQELSDNTYQPGGYDTFMLYDTKARMISAAPFRDRVVHHALCNVIEPIF